MQKKIYIYKIIQDTIYRILERKKTNNCYLFKILSYFLNKSTYITRYALIIFILLIAKKNKSEFFLYRAVCRDIDKDLNNATLLTT